jgi:hypothetical protein
VSAPKEPSKEAQVFVEEWTKLRWRHGAELIAAGRDIEEGWVRADDLAALFDQHAARGKWKCGADAYADPPRDCNFPHCGCDPGAEKVLDAIREEGYLSPDEAQVLRSRLRAADELIARFAGLHPALAAYRGEEGKAK